jgi:hypothetical protein
LTSSTLFLSATDWMEVSAIAQIVTAGVAILAVLGAVVQLSQNRRIVRTTRAHRYLERYGNPREIPLVANLSDFLVADPAKRSASLARWKAMSTQERLEIIHGLNFWEELAGMYMRRLVDRAVVRDYFGSSALAYRARWRWFIDYQRTLQGSVELMKQFEIMCNEIEEGRRSATQRMTFPYMHRWWRTPRTEQVSQTQKELDDLRDWQRDLAVADPAEQARMLRALGAPSQQH